MTDLVFGELEEYEYLGCYGGWRGKQVITFGGNPCSIELLIQQSEEEGEITKHQYEAYHHFMERWPSVQPKLIEALIKYYNEVERFAWGPDNAEEFAKWWPEIATEEALLQAVTLETIVIPWDFTMTEAKCGRYIYLLFSRTWGGEDMDDNGIGVGFLNEDIDEIAYKDIAY